MMEDFKEYENEAIRLRKMREVKEEKKEEEKKEEEMKEEASK